MIPLYGCIAGSGKICSLDDPTVVKDLAALAGTGGVAFIPYLISTPLSISSNLGYSRLRRFLQRLTHGATITLKITGIRDGRESGLPVTREISLSNVGLLNAPFNDQGSDFQIKLEVIDYTKPVALGNSEVYVVQHRSSR